MRALILIWILAIYCISGYSQNEFAQQLLLLNSYQEKVNLYEHSTVTLKELRLMLNEVRTEDEKLELLLFYTYKMFTIDISKAIVQSSEALEISRKLNKPLQEGMALRYIARIYSLNPKGNEGLLYADSAVQVAKNIKDYGLLSKIYKTLYSIYSHKEKYDTSTYYFLKSVEISNNYTYGYVKNKQLLYFSKFALEYNNITLAEQTLNAIEYKTLETSKVQFLLLKSELHQSRTLTDSVEFYFNKALINFPNNPYIYSQLGSYLMQHNKLDSALSLYHEAIAIKDSHDSHFSDIYRAIANIYQTKKVYDSTEYYLKKCIDEDKRLGELYKLAKSNSQLATFYFKKDLYDSASKYAHIAYNLAKESNLAESLVEVTHILSQIAAYYEDYQKAYSYSQKNRTYARQLNQIKVTQLLKKTEIEKYLKQWTTSQQKNIEEAEQKKNMVIIVAIFLFIILTLLYYRFRSNQKALNAQRQLTKKINEQYEEIQSQGEELTVINEELSALNDELEMRIAKRTEELKNSNEQLEIYNKRLMQYANLTAHNIKAPLASIKGLVSLLNKETTSMDEIIAITKHIQTSSLELDSIIGQMSDLMNIDKISQNEYKFIQTESMVEEVEHWLVNLTQGQVMNIHKQISIDQVYAVKRYLVSILKELCQNAFSFKNPDRKLEISIEIQKVKQYIEIKVQDNGLGIDLAKHREDIFQIHKRFHDDINGRGVGLYYVKRKTEALGGSIDIESVPQQGTSFIITLPDKNG